MVKVKNETWNSLQVTIPITTTNKNKYKIVNFYKLNNKWTINKNYIKINGMLKSKILITYLPTENNGKWNKNETVKL